MGPKRAPTRSKMTAILVLSRVQAKRKVNRLILVTRIFFPLSSPSAFLSSLSNKLKPSRTSTIEIVLNVREKRGLNATRYLSLWMAVSNL